jgi:hypothetical protein
LPGLDPGIHAAAPGALTVRMDCRVKPGNDSEKTGGPVVPANSKKTRGDHFAQSIA